MTYAMNETVTLSRDGHIAEVTLNRPEKYNALSPAVFEGLAAAGEAVRADPEIRAVVLAGAGKNFCAGLDLQSFSSGGFDRDAFRDKALNLAEGEIANPLQKPVYVWKEVQVPVIAAIQGVTYGGGTQVALGADFRIAAPDTRMSVMEIKWGLIPDMGLTTVLPRLTRMDVAKDLILTGRVVGAEEARDLGLITRIADDPLAAAREAAADIAARSPDAIRGGKALIEETWSASPADALRREAELQVEIMGQPNQIEAVMANMQKRAPNFS
ncbi:MAG: crotonase/enoyl-CoA hydratase family protein [Pseudomonadota bacterium]